MRKIATGEFADFGVRRGEVVELGGGESDMREAVEDGDGGGSGVVGTDRVFKRLGRAEVLRVGHAVCDDGGL